jgi:hypothetical protein
MRISTLILILCLLGSGYYLYTQHQTIARLQGEVGRLQAELQKAQPASDTGVRIIPDTKEASAGKVICPWCKGEGRIMVRREKGTDDMVACVVCGSLGCTTRVMPPNAKQCPDCYGMGYRAYSGKEQRYIDPGAEVDSETGRLTRKTCKRCSGSGYLVIPPPTGSSQR